SQALNDLEKAVGIDSSDDYAQYNLGSLYGFSGRYADSIKSYTQAINIGRSYVHPALLYRAQVYVAAGQYANSINDINDYFDGSDGSASTFTTVAYLTRGAAYLYKGEYQQAKADYVAAFNQNRGVASLTHTNEYGYWVTPKQYDLLGTLKAQLGKNPSDSN